MKLPPICQQCVDKAHCSSLCNGIDILANGNIPCKEILLSDPYDDHHTNRDYNKVLAEVQTAQSITIEQIRDIDSLQLKSIAALLYADMSVSQVALQLNISPSYIYRLIRVHKLNKAKLLLIKGKST